MITLVTVNMSLSQLIDFVSQTLASYVVNIFQSVKEVRHYLRWSLANMVEI